MLADSGGPNSFANGASMSRKPSLNVETCLCSCGKGKCEESGGEHSNSCTTPRSRTKTTELHSHVLTSPRTKPTAQLWSILGMTLVFINTVLGLVLLNSLVHRFCTDPTRVHLPSAQLSTMHPVSLGTTTTTTTTTTSSSATFTNVSVAIATAVSASPSAAEGTWQALDDVRNATTLMLTFANDYFPSLMVNWAKHVQLLGLPYVVAVYDETAATICKQNGVRWIWADQQFSSSSFRKELARLVPSSMMGSMKPKLVMDLFEHGHFRSITVSDTDTVWLRDPQQLIDMHPSADMFISTDCLSLRAEEEVKLNWNRCGHTEGSYFGNALNIGAMVFKRMPGANSVLREWHAQMSKKAKDLVLSGKGETGSVNEQAEMVALLMKDSVPLQGLPEDKRVVLLKKRTVRVLPIPVLQAAGGHTYFYQHLQRLEDAVPFVVHNTFSRHGAGNIAKTIRFREEGLWLVEPEGYFDGPQQYITYSNDVAQWIDARAAAWRTSHKLNMTWHHKHMLGATYQLSVLQDMWAAAKALNRTLILPEFVCYCDQDLYANVLQECKVVGSDLQLPFACPSDIFMNTDILDNTTSQFGMPYRTKSFLLSNKVPESVKRSYTTIKVQNNLTQVQATEGHSLASAQAYMHIKDLDLVRAMAPVADSRILAFSGVQPGMFGGFSSTAAAREFDKFWAKITGVGWCCSGLQWDKQWDKVFWRYKLPAPVVRRMATAADTTIADMPRPAFCDSNVLLGDAKDALAFNNHPCKYLPKK